MGVKGLWEILDEARCYTDIKDLSTLRGKILAVDVSIWLYQFIKAVPSSHKPDEVSPLVIGGLFQRLCKLLHYGIKPIFVFDGAAPTLKSETVKQRQALRHSADSDYQRIAKKLLKNRMKLAALDSDLPANDQRQENESIIPPIDQFLELSDTDEELITFNFDKDSCYFESFIDDSNAFMDIDINSPDFKCLPFHIQEKVLFGYRKRTLNLKEATNDPQQSDDIFSPDSSLQFSRAQVEAVIKRRRLMSALESIRGSDASLDFYSDPSAKKQERLVASNSEKAYVFVKNSRAGWSFELTEEAGSTVKSQDLEKDPIEAEDGPEDECEFMKSLFGDEDGASPLDSTIETRELGASREDGKYKEEPEVEPEESTIQMPPPKPRVQLSELYEMILSDEESKTDHLSEPVLKISETKKFVKDSAFTAPLAAEAKERIVLDQDYQEFIKKVSDSDANYSHLVDQLRQERSVLSAQFESLQAASTAPTKALTSAFMQLLHDFGLPFIMAPFEAEAQCAALEDLVHGVISDDSDCLLFGAGRVYRHFFSSKSNCKCYNTSAWCNQFTRTDLVVLAHLLGCDYCVGVPHFGPKRATELLKAIKTLSGGYDSVDVLISEIKCFACSSEEINPRLQKMLSESLPSSFGERRVTDAFYRPIVDVVAKDSIKWRPFNLEALCDFMAKKALWPRERTRRSLELLKKYIS